LALCLLVYKQMNNNNRKYWFLTLVMIMNVISGLSQVTTIDQKLSVFSNSHVNGGEFVIEYQIKGSNLCAASTLGSLNADIIYDSTAIRFVNESTWNSKIASPSYENFVSNNKETGISRSVRIMVAGLNVNSDSLVNSESFDLGNNYSTVVRLNFIILDNTKSTTLSFKPSTNQVGLFSNPGNNPNTFEIQDHILSAPVIIENETLPVTLSGFASTVKVNNVTLNWSTSGEINNAGFGVERKLSGENNWQSVGFVKGQGNSNTLVKYSFEDNKLTAGKYNYRLKQTDNNGNYKYYNLNNSIEVGTPSNFNLSQNYPNPFNPLTKINYELPKDSKVSISVFDVLGREVMSLINQDQKAGYYTISADGKNLASGTYFYRLIAKSDNNDYVITKKMSVIK